LTYATARRDPSHPDFNKWKENNKYILSFHCKLITTRSNDIWDGKVMKHFINEYKVLSK